MVLAFIQFDLDYFRNLDINFFQTECTQLKTLKTEIHSQFGVLLRPLKESSSGQPKTLSTWLFNLAVTVLPYYLPSVTSQHSALHYLFSPARAKAPPYILFSVQHTNAEQHNIIQH